MAVILMETLPCLHVSQRKREIEGSRNFKTDSQYVDLLGTNSFFHSSLRPNITAAHTHGELVLVFDASVKQWMELLLLSETLSNL